MGWSCEMEGRDWRRCSGAGPWLRSELMLLMAGGVIWSAARLLSRQLCLLGVVELDVHSVRGRGGGDGWRECAEELAWRTRQVGTRGARKFTVGQCEITL
jgi:hypothetical protein